MPATLKPSSVAKRRCWQFSLRTVLICTLLVGVGLGWYLKRRAIAERRERFATMIEEYPFGTTWSVFANQKARVDQPVWDRLLLGDDWPSYAIELDGVNIDSDDDLAAVCALTQLERLALCSWTQNELDRTRLAGLRNLKELVLWDGEFNSKALAELPRLESLDLYADEESQVAALQGLKQLKKLRLGGDGATDASLVFLRDLENLVELDLSWTSISDVGVATLAGLPRLQSLNLYRTNVSATGLDQLRSAPRLRALTLSNGDEALPNLRFFSQLESLHLHQGLTDEGMQYLRDMTNLKDLAIVQTRISDAGLSSLANLRKLEKLKLQSNQLSGGGLQYLSELVNLRSLDLRSIGKATPVGYFCVDPQAFTLGLSDLLKNQSNLEEFMASGPVNDQNLALLSKSKRLRILAIGYLGNNLPFQKKTNGAVGLTDTGMAYLSNLTELKILMLANGSQITDAGLQSLRGLNKLEMLDLSGAPITERGLAVLKGLTRLEALDLRGTKLTDPTPLRQFPKLRLVFMEPNRISASKLAQLLPNCHVDERGSVWAFLPPEWETP